jgi:hypothetical protein
MSPTRKPKPPDKGVVPDHKPSRKVTLDEVLRNLQDLVSNELAIEPAKPAAPVEAPAAAAGAEPAPLPKAAPTPTEEFPVAMESESITLEGLPEPATDPEPLRLVPPEGIQQDLPYLDLAPETPAEEAQDRPAPPRPGPALPEIEAIALPDPAPEPAVSHAADGDTLADLAPPLPPGVVEPAAPPGEDRGHPAEDGTLSDIPVLEDAIELADELEPPAGGSALPSAAEARRLAIQVAARLNVELRKAGKPGLSSEVITRLAHLLEETLAKGAANMDNNPPEKH